MSIQETVDKLRQEVVNLRSDSAIAKDRNSVLEAKVKTLTDSVESLRSELDDLSALLGLAGLGQRINNHETRIKALEWDEDFELRPLGPTGNGKSEGEKIADALIEKSMSCFSAGEICLDCIHFESCEVREYIEDLGEDTTVSCNLRQTAGDWTEGEE